MRDDLSARNGTYVAMHFPVPTTFETSYVIDGSPREIVADEAAFFLDLEDRLETMIIMWLGDGCGVFDTSRGRDELGTRPGRICPIRLLPDNVGNSAAYIPTFLCST